MRALRALFRGWLNHPWRAFWLIVVVLFVLVLGGGAFLREHMRGVARLPNALADLTAPATNAKGETAGPFIDRLPKPPSRWTDYRYQARGRDVQHRE